MFKSLLGLALAVPATAGVADDFDQTQCQSLTTDSLNIFDITDIENVDAYTFDVSGGEVRWNYCTFLDGISNAYGVWKRDGEELAIATQHIVPGSAENIRDANDATKTIGVSFSQGSDTECKDVSSKKYSMKTNIICHEDGTGTPTVEVSTVDKCEFVVDMKNKAGCPTVNTDSDQYTHWLSEYELYIGILFMVIGPLLAIFGLQWFTYLATFLIYIFAIGFTAMLSRSYLAPIGVCTFFTAGFVLSLVAGCYFRDQIWIMIPMVGLTAGFFSGALIFAVIASASGWSEPWCWWVITILMAIQGTILAQERQTPAMMYTTSFVGAYLFTRAWTLFYPGHWPSEAQILSNPESIEIDAFFWAFLGLFIVSFIASIFIQKKRAEHIDMDLDDYHYKRTR